MAAPARPSPSSEEPVPTSVDPNTGVAIQAYPETSAAEIDGRLSAAVAAQRLWADLPVERRAESFRKLSASLIRGRDALAALATREMGKPIAQAGAEIEKCARCCAWLAGHAAAILTPQSAATEARSSFVRFDPLGLVLAIMPWNFPYWQVIRAAVPALAAGNGVVLKHASNVPGCALALERAFVHAGFPPGLFTALLIPGSAAEALIDDPRIAAVTLTGSEPAGRSVAARAGAALKKTVLELGGSDPFLVLADADLDLAVREAVRARLQNNGQSCIAAKRFIVERDVADAFERAFADAMSRVAVGDPMDREIEVGPLARADLVDALDRQVQESVAAGAALATGGKRIARPGFFYTPTVLTQVSPGMAAFDEETFGPLATVSRARDMEHALELANLSGFGLGASVWTGNAKRGEALAVRIDAGAVFVNGMVRSDPRLPFGGVKRSGYGRELSAFGIREFVNVKTVWVEATAPVAPTGVE
jgi:acyl-CoA reductase-like NAD-dependent aldehyde dehydrogenase